MDSVLEIIRVDVMVKEMLTRRLEMKSTTDPLCRFLHQEQYWEQDGMVN